MKITFIPYTAQKTTLINPEPAIKNLPEWYKQKPPHLEGKKDRYYANGTKNITVKRCNPFGDALSAGYVIKLENDLWVTQTELGPDLVWGRGGTEFIGGHSLDQISKDMVPPEYSDQPFKFTNYWSVKTPKGYSSIFTHPMNRTDLPFITLDGVVETDTYEMPVNFPFLIRNDFEGLIEAGTPIAQVMPFKRQDWSMEVNAFNEDFYEKTTSEFGRTLYRYYKRFHWVRKRYN